MIHVWREKHNAGIITYRYENREIHKNQKRFVEDDQIADRYRINFNPLSLPWLSDILYQVRIAYPSCPHRLPFLR